MTEPFAFPFRDDLPPPAKRWNGFPRYNFVGGHNDPERIPVDDLIRAATDVLTREGHTLATYRLQSGPLGYAPLRGFIASELAARAGMNCDADEVLLTTGSMQALELVNDAFVQPGDTVVLEEASYGGALGRLKGRGVNCVGVPVDEDGMRSDRLAAILDDLAAQGRRPKFIYTIPTVQNPTGTVMSRQRRLDLLAEAARHELMVFEDDCYADLIWEGERPPALHALDRDGRVVYCGSFSKSIAPALRVGYLVADWAVLSRILPLKRDGGSGALEQMVLAEFASTHFDDHVDALSAVLRGKYEIMAAALNQHFGTHAEFAAPKGGIFVWVTFPDAVDTSRLAELALAEGIEINAGAQWSADPESGRHRARLCFGSASKQEIEDGVALLADICYRETGIPPRSGNVQR